MATLATNAVTLNDVLSPMGPDNKYLAIGEMLSQTNEVLDDMGWLPTNKETSHVMGVRTGLPDIVFRKLNQGVPKTKNVYAQMEEQCAMMEAQQEIDVDMPGVGNGFRALEGLGFTEALNQKMANQLFNGTNLSGAEFVGLNARFSDSTAQNGQNIIKAGGAGSDNTSIYLVVWGAQSVFGIYPKDSAAGLYHEDLGKQRVTDASGNPFYAYVDRYVWKCGLALKDWRYVVRIPNIDVSNLVGESSAADLVKLMSRAMDRIPSFGVGKAAFYMNRTVHSALKIQALNKSTNALSIEQGLRQIETRFLGVPLRKVDAIGNAEALVV